MAKGDPVKVVARDGLYIPIKLLTEDQKDDLRKRFSKNFYGKEKTCEKCEYYTERPCDVCDSCANYLGKISLARPVIRNDKEWFKVPYGGLQAVRKRVGKVNLVDKTKSPAMRRSIKFTRKLRPDQKEARDAIIAARQGILKSPPRSGKTVISAAAICKMGLKTLVLAAQSEWIDNFMETFLGSEVEQAFTDARPKRVGRAKKLADFEKYDVAFATYQTFLSEGGQKLLKKIVKMFGAVFVDEIQGGNATEYARILSQFHAEVRIGLSGTPERKDQKHWVIDQLFGTVFFENKVERMTPKVKVTETDLRGPIPQSWTYAVKKIECDPKRLMLIAETAIRDIKEEKHLVYIPLARNIAIEALTKTINRLYGKNIAQSLTGQTRKDNHRDARKNVIIRAREYKTKCVVGNIKLLSTGVNIPRASALYEVTPSSNIPKADQRFSRVLTPHEGKPQPVIRYFLDDVDLRRGCMRNEFFQCLLPRFKPEISEKVRTRLYEYLGQKAKPRRGRNELRTGGSL